MSGRTKSPAEQFSAGNQVRLHRAGEPLFSEMLRSIEAARQFVEVEMYWFSGDRLGRRFFRALTERASRGIQVRLLYDAFGSVGTSGSHFEALRAAGGSVVAFNPISPLKKRFYVGRLTRRNHRKLVLTEQCGFVGGANLATEWLEPENGGEGFRDDVVCLRGPCVAALHAAFSRSFADAGGVPSQDALRISEAPGGMRVAVLAQSQIRERRRTIEAYLSRLSSAKRRIYLSNAYFVPNRKIIRALVEARARGVDVRIMLPARSDVEIVRVASQAVWSRLLRAGVRLFLWLPSVLHSKSGVIDSEWSTVGSFNLDYISVRNNSELNISVLDEGFAKTMSDSFLADLASCEEVDAAVFLRRPTIDRLVQRSAYWFREWL